MRITTVYYVNKQGFICNIMPILCMCEYKEYIIEQGVVGLLVDYGIYYGVLSIV